jgi:ABC-type branched-subunit amino acid transport system substrate-binding protein
MVVLGTIIRETIGTIAEARKTGFNPVFLGSSAAYTDLIHKLGGKAMDGLYATMTVQNPYLDEASQPMRFWANKYKTKFNEDPTVFSAYGYTIIDLFAKAAQKAGPNLSTDSFIKAMDTMTVHRHQARHRAFGRTPQSLTFTPPSTWAAICRACRRWPRMARAWQEVVSIQESSAWKCCAAPRRA